MADFGERHARTQLEQALSGHGVQFQGTGDKKVDLLLQFRAPDPAGSLLYLGVQVKTGPSYVRKIASGRIFLKVGSEGLAVWRSANLPIALMWVNPDSAECHWTLVTERTQHQYLSVSMHARVTPALPFELAAKLIRLRTDPNEHRLSLLHPGLSAGLRQAAKKYYRSALVGTELSHPIFGKVGVTWKAWRHLTRRQRSKSFIRQSLRLLPAVKWVTEHPSTFRSVRRFKSILRGRWTTELRLFVFDTAMVVLPGSSHTTIRTVFRERVTFPADWLTQARYQDAVRREVSFESIYEKNEERRGPSRR